MRRTDMAGIAVGLAALGAGGVLALTAHSDEPDVSVCVEALDAADAGFDSLAVQVRTVQEALREAFDGNVGAANRTLGQVQRVDPSSYKRLEAQCREAVK